MSTGRKFGGSSVVYNKVSRVDMAEVLIVMGADTLEVTVSVSVSAAASHYSSQFKDYSGARVVIGTVPLKMDVDTVEVAAAETRSSTLILEVRVVGEAGGYFNFMLKGEMFGRSVCRNDGRDGIKKVFNLGLDEHVWVRASGVVSNRF